MGFDFSGISISGGGAGANSANKSLSNLDAEGNAKFTDKQDKLVSGTNIKSVNGFSLLGSGNIEISESGSISVDQNYDGTSANAQSGTAVAEGLLTVANKDLSNLSSAGQMVIDSQNETISNCILEIPQNLQCSIDNNILTLSKGSIITLPAAVYTTYTTTSDFTRDLSTLSDGDYIVFAATTGIQQPRLKSVIGSGTTLPADDSTYSVFFIPSENKIYRWTEGEWRNWPVAYPICEVIVSGGSATFARDSNGNDMIFNGAGFIGHHAFVYPNVKALVVNGLNADKSLRSVSVVNNSLQIVELQTYPTTTRRIYISISAYCGQQIFGSEVNTFSDLVQDNWAYQYVKSENLYYEYHSSAWHVARIVDLISYKTSTTGITDFTIRQPVRTATVEMLDKKQDTLTFDSAPTSASTNPVTSGGVYTALSGKANTATTLTGYGITDGANTALSNLSADGQMIVDSVNGTISNCILEIPQNIKLEDNGSGTITLKSGSVIILGGSTYTTLTTSSDSVFSETGDYADRDYVLFYNSTNGQLERQDITEIVSGNTDSLSGVKTHVWFDTTNKVINHYSGTSTTQDKTYPYPIAVINKNGGSFYSIKKDSNGNDMIFNGACFVGHHAVVYPNVKGLIPDGLNVDGSLKSTDVIRDSLYIRELTSGNFKLWCMSTGSIWSAGFKGEVNNINDVPLTNGIYYVKNQNVNIQVYNNTLSVYSGMICADYTYDGTTVTDLTIRQPVRTATVEMLDSATKDKQADLTTVSGYDATATQVLKNINGVLTWVTEE